MQIYKIVDGSGWPKDSHKVEHNNVILWLIPVIDGIEIDTDSKFHVEYNRTDEQFELTFFEFQEK
jgi:hypothetical protein